MTSRIRLGASSILEARCTQAMDTCYNVSIATRRGLLRRQASRSFRAAGSQERGRPEEQAPWAGTRGSQHPLLRSHRQSRPWLPPAHASGQQAEPLTSIECFTKDLV